VAVYMSAPVRMCPATAAQLLGTSKQVISHALQASSKVDSLQQLQLFISLATAM